jgi:hypothetical protein
MFCTVWHLCPVADYIGQKIKVKQQSYLCYLLITSTFQSQLKILHLFRNFSSTLLYLRSFNVCLLKLTGFAYHMSIFFCIAKMALNNTHT